MLRSQHTSSAVTYEQVMYEDVFSTSIRKQKQATELYRKLLEIRTKILSSQPEAVTGPMH